MKLYFSYYAVLMVEMMCRGRASSSQGAVCLANVVKLRRKIFSAEEANVGVFTRPDEAPLKQ
jgi:hypothetical protein